VCSIKPGKPGIDFGESVIILERLLIDNRVKLREYLGLVFPETNNLFANNGQDHLSHSDLHPRDDLLLKFAEMSHRDVTFC